MWFQKYGFCEFKFNYEGEFNLFLQISSIKYKKIILFLKIDDFIFIKQQNH